MTFEEYYRKLFNSEAEFQQFLNNLTAEHKPVLRFRQQDQARLQELWAKQQLPWQLVPEYSNALLWPDNVPLGTPLPGFAEKLIYPMNVSSLYPVLALDPQPGEQILDACAAPGGKALAIYDRMTGEGELIANDSSPARVYRMRQVFQEYGAAGVTIWQKKAEIIFKRYPEYFDKILLDAPCSSEKHVYTQPKYLAQWTPARIKHLKQRQIALINGLWLALKPGGRLVYSTCAVNQEENEGVVADFLKRHPEAQQLTEQRIWPDADRFDPMFIAAFQK